MKNRDGIAPCVGRVGREAWRLGAALVALNADKKGSGADAVEIEFQVAVSAGGFFGGVGGVVGV
jgi:hypothetical protein